MGIRRWASDCTLAVLGSTDHRSTDGPTGGVLAIIGPTLDGGIATGDWRAALLGVYEIFLLCMLLGAGRSRLAKSANL